MAKAGFCTIFRWRLPREILLPLLALTGQGKVRCCVFYAGILQPTSGEIELYGTPLPQFKAWEKIGYVPQNPAKQHRDFPISVKEVIGLGLLCGSSMFQKISRAGKARVETMLERFYLQELAHRKIGELSGGQQQRVFLARAMVRQPNCAFGRACYRSRSGCENRTVQNAQGYQP